MAIGIWTPVYASTQKVVFGERLSTLANKKQTLAVPAGAHMKITNMGCHPVFIHNSDPASDDFGLTGVPICGGYDVVLPRITPIWIYSPYDNSTVHVTVGALT